MNILCILIDTLRADHLGCYGYTKPTSPHIDHIASQGVLFDSAFAQRTTAMDAGISQHMSGTGAVAELGEAQAKNRCAQWLVLEFLARADRVPKVDIHAGFA